MVDSASNSFGKPTLLAWSDTENSWAPIRPAGRLPGSAVAARDGDACDAVAPRTPTATLAAAPPTRSARRDTARVVPLSLIAHPSAVDAGRSSAGFDGG